MTTPLLGQTLANECCQALIDLANTLQTAELPPEGTPASDLYEWGIATLELYLPENIEEATLNGDWATGVKNAQACINAMATEFLHDSLYREPLTETDPPVYDRRWVLKEGDLAHWMAIAAKFPQLEWEGLSPFDAQPIQRSVYPLVVKIISWAKNLPVFLRPAQYLEQATPTFSATSAPFARRNFINPTILPTTVEQAHIQLLSYRQLALTQQLISAQTAKSVNTNTSQNLSLTPSPANSLSLLFRNLTEEVNKQSAITKQSIKHQANKILVRNEENIAKVKAAADEKMAFKERIHAEEKRSLQLKSEALQKQTEQLGEKFRNSCLHNDQNTQHIEWLTQKTYALKSSVDSYESENKDLYQESCQRGMAIEQLSHQVGELEFTVGGLEQQKQQHSQTISQQSAIIQSQQQQIQRTEYATWTISQALSREKERADKLDKEGQAKTTRINQLGAEAGQLRHQLIHCRSKKFSICSVM